MPLSFGQPIAFLVVYYAKSQDLANARLSVTLSACELALYLGFRIFPQPST